MKKDLIPLIEKLKESKNPLKLKNQYQNTLYWERLRDEFITEIKHLNSLAKDFIFGSVRPAMETNLVNGKTTITDENLIIDGQQVMQSWQKKLMRTVVEASNPVGKDTLEIGFGLGIASEFIQQAKPSKHTIIECNPTVFAEMQKWAEVKDADIKLIEGKWQDILPTLSLYEAILFDPYPFDEKEFKEYWYDDGNFDVHFFPEAAKHLKQGGTFSYFSNEIDSLSRKHQRQLLEHFSSIEIQVVKDLQPPENCQYWWAPTMAVVRATK